jgi:outer membrane receptor protein involved in Fe transport
MRNRVLVLSGLVVFLLAYPAGKLFAQAVYGSIIGTVTDNTGAVVPGAKVTITDVGKGVSFSATTNATGYYEQGHLIAGTYEVRVEAQGFQTFVQKDVAVSVDVATLVNAALTVGAVTQEITVTAAVPLLKTEKADVATGWTDRQVEDLPIYNRNFTTFQLLSPGNQRLNGWNHAASENPQGSQQILTQGQHFAGTAFELDGTDNQDPILGIIVINPNLESVTEVKITAVDYDAQFGKAIGAVVTAQTKSGTNSLHGSLFDYERSNSNFARNPFTQKQTVPKGNWNQFGASAGGPIKKDKIFIFGDYQGTRRHLGGSNQDRIPTAAERGGDLSVLLPGTIVFDPYFSTPDHSTLTDAAGNPLPSGAPPVTAPSQLRTAFGCTSATLNQASCATNIIPASRLSPQAQALLALYPVGASGLGLNPNFFGSGGQIFNDDGFDVRPDAYISEKLHVFGRYSFQRFNRAGPGLFGISNGVDLGGPALVVDPSLGQFAGSSKVKNQSLAAGFDYTVNPTWLTDFRLGWFKYHVNVLPGGFGTKPLEGLANPIPGLNTVAGEDPFFTSGMPFFDISVPGAQNFQFGYALGPNQCNCPLLEDEHQWQFVNNWTHMRGNHTIKFGADIRKAYNLRVPSDAHRAGQIHFNNDVSQGCLLYDSPGVCHLINGSPDIGGGAGLGGFLLGSVSTFERNVSTSTTASETQPRLFFYGQDTWRVTSKLTVNYGLRWEIYKPESVNKAGNGGWLDPLTGEIRVAGQNGVDLRGNTSTNYKHFSPRLGIAYQLNAKTVVRLGYGRSYDIGVFGSIFGHTVTQNLPVLGQQQLNPGTAQTAFILSQGPPGFSPDTALTVGNCNAITDPTGTKTECVGPNGNPLLPNNVSSRARPFNNRLPTIDAWNATLQHQLTPTISLSVAYVGNKGTHTLIGDNPAYNINNATEVGFTPGSNQNLRKPYFPLYGWTQGIDYFGNDANNKFNAFEVTFEKRYAGGLTFQGSYTFQHANYYANDGYYNIAHVTYGPNPNYRNQVFIFTVVYELPFGRGKKYAGNVSRLADLIVGGWRINSTTNISSGLPFTPGISTCGPSIDNGPCRPNITGSVANGPRSGAPDNSPGYWFQTTGGVSIGSAGASAGPWAQPALATFGNVGYDSFRGPKFWNTDFSLFKTFNITETAKAELQFEAFNVFNHRNLDLPNSCVDCGNGGEITNIAFGSQMRALQFGLKISF